MAKQFFSQSVLNSYSVPRKRYIPYAILLATIMLLLLFYVCSSSESVQSHRSLSHASYLAVEAGLSKNLNWLSNPSSEGPSTLKKISMQKSLTTKTKAQSAYRAPIDSARLKAGSLVFHSVESAAQSKTHKLAVSLSTDRIVAGEVLHAVLESAIQSDLPGPVRAMLAEPVYAYGSTQLLLPVGTRIIGEYQNKVTSTQQRLGICWRRMILPDGRSVDIDAPAVDPIGRVGVRATEINRHFWQRFGEATLYSLLSAGAQVSDGLDADTLTAGQVLRAEMSDSFSNTALSMLEENKQTAVTLSLDSGSDISIFVRHDILF